MKKEINPAIIIGIVVVVLGVVGFAIYQALTGTAPTVAETAGSGKDKTAVAPNGKPIPPGVPADYMKSMGGGKP